MVNHTKKYSTKQRERMRQMYEGYVASWAIAQEFGFSGQKSFRAYARSEGWQRPADFRAKLDEDNTVKLTKKKEAYLRKAWVDGSTTPEMEAELGICYGTICKQAKLLELGPRNRKAVFAAARQRMGHEAKAKHVQRLWNHSNLTPEEIAAEVDVTRGTLIQLVRRGRARGEFFRTLMPRYTTTLEDREILRDGYRLGVAEATIARLLSSDTRKPCPACIQKWAKAMQLVHRNSQPFMLRQLAPELLWAYREYTGEDPCILVQKAFTISNQMSLVLAQRAIVDYHRAMARFPELVDMMEGVKKCFWWRDIKPVRDPHPFIYSLRTQHGIRKRA
jgi:hypothetical protein